MYRLYWVHKNAKPHFTPMSIITDCHKVNHLLEKGKKKLQKLLRKTKFYDLLSKTINVVPNKIESSFRLESSSLKGLVAL